MKCDNCGLRVETLRMVCEPCFIDIKNKPDADLRDEVAKAVLQTWLITLSARYGKAFKKDEDIAEEAAYLAFISTDAFMSERARRREAKQ